MLSVSLHVQKSRQFLIDSLHERFGGGPCKWHFVAKGTGRGWLCSEVVDKHLPMIMKSKLIFME